MLEQQPKINSNQFFSRREESSASLEERIQALTWERMRQDINTRVRFAFNLIQNEDDQSPVGHYTLAIHYRHGWGVEQNYAKAIEHYKSAAEKGHAGACFEMARLYLQGNTLMRVDKDLDTAKYYANIPSRMNNIDTEYDRPGFKQAEYKERLDALLQVIELFRPEETNKQEIPASAQYRFNG